MQPMRMWAFRRPDGSILADSSFTSEADAWCIGLGWPSDGEIEEAKARGFRVMMVSVLPAADPALDPALAP